MDPLDVFSSPTRTWFERAFAAPTPAQRLGWPPIAAGGHVLLQAPTGSGKTLAAFLLGIDRLNETPGEGLRLLYVSPLKALNYDIERNLRSPLAGLGSKLSVGVRTGDTPADERRRMLRTPPDILITTPESLFLLLTSQARETLRGVETVIVDEVHAVAGTKRGAHLVLSLERLERLVENPFQRVGLSATQRPLEEIGRFVAGSGREITLVDAGVRKELDLEVVVPVEDMRELGSTAHLSVPPLADGVEMGPGVEQSSRSIWPSIYPAVLDLVRAHRSTIVFVNSRRLAERLALRLNELAGEELARAHHGSLAREQRVVVEELLKAGQIPCLVATSSLELGIDMGAVDLVIQIESPKSVARGLQRVGRAGHDLNSVSKGRIFPKFRADLLESAVVAKAMREGAIEETRIPRNPLDVLSQQLVAICADEEVSVDELHELVRRAYPFSDLSLAQLENVLDMLAGRYPSDEFAELRPRIVWDRTAGVVRGRTGARLLAVTNAGTIPDRGLFGVFLVDGGGRVGELDEEMVYEARAGQTFLLGASTWRIEEITHDRVLVSPAPGLPGVAPFWKGEGVGRPAELGEKIGRAARELAALSDDAATRVLEGDYSLDARAARNLVAYLREQESATGVVPSDRAVVVERFRDEIGDWRVCVLTPFGGRVHAPWAMALRARLRDSLPPKFQLQWLRFDAINNRVLFQYRLHGELEAGIYFLQTWLMKAQDYGDEFMVGSILLRMGELFAAAVAYSDALGALEKVEPVASRLMGPQIQIAIRSQRGLWKSLNGDYESGFQDIDHALTQARGLGSSSLVEAIPLVAWASAVLWQPGGNEIPNAVRRCEQALDLLRGSGGSWVDVLGKALAASARLHLRLSQGNDVAASKALSRAQELVRLAEVSPEASAPNEFLSVYALALRASGREEEALPLLREAYDWLDQVAARLEDRSLKRSWLESVPENREILSAWEGRAGG
jgi:ATP-dependent Lhr-like helicase